MKNSVNLRIIILFLLAVCSSLTLNAADIYVSHTQSGTGAGTQANPYSIAGLYSSVINGSVPSDGTINIYFEKGGSYTMPGQFSGGSGYGSSAIGFQKDTWHRKVVTMDVYGEGTPVIFDGNNSINIFLSFSGTRSSSNGFTLNVKNIIFENFSASGSTAFIYFTTGSNFVSLNNVTIRNCNNTSTHLFHLTQSSAELHISNSSIINNNRGTNYLMYFSSANAANIYNNTFSTNTAGEAIRIETSGIRFFNNTIYNSGSVRSSSASNGQYVINNILAGSSQLYSGNAYLSNAKRNISTTGSTVYYYESGYSSGTNITSNFNSQFDTNLVELEEPGKQFHKADIVLNNNVIYSQGGTLTSLYSDLGLTASNINIQIDQIGNTRPTDISLGSLDPQTFQRSTKSQFISSLYDSGGTPSSPQPVSIDLSQFLSIYPLGVNVGDITFTVDDSTLDNGTISYDVAPGGRYITFNPYNLQEASSSFEVTIRATDQYGIIHEYVISFITYIFDKALETTFSVIPPGYISPEEYETCYDFMGTVEFTSAYRFRTELVSTPTNPTSNRMAGFSIPLVADLDGDGYPEIIGLSVPDNMTTSLDGNYNGIQIYNGQTGALISKLAWPGSAAGTYTHSGYHGSPATMTIVDSDRDGIKELIMCFPNGGGPSAYRSTIMSYKLNPIKTNGVTTAYTMTENPKWPSTPQKYNTGGSSGTATQSSYEKPVPTVVDIDGDGEPEVVVYNKVYSAVTGQLLLTLETLNAGTSPAYVGYDSSANGADSYVGFNYVYDMDFDGIYDVIAGGKIYKIEKNGSSFSYSTITMSGVPDGRTGVADINGDGIPDVVVVTRNSGSVVRVVVWNPNLYIVENGNIVKNPTGPFPTILADMTFSMSTGGGGSNSYVYIGDIDGHEQVVDGKTYRLPEIAILGNNISFSNFEHHPNISGGNMPTSGSTSGSGQIMGLTWDANPNVTDLSKKLKLSFVLEHSDRSMNTGFTMFDFDNDGMMEICYRDEATLRIIKAARPYIKLADTDKDVILFNEPVISFTGFEYPVIADIDNDASAEMVVMGQNQGSTAQTRGYIYALGNGSGDKFAPALSVWNQFMYDPFKINEDLTTPEGPAPNRLDYSFYRVIEGQDKRIEFNPYNATLSQATKFMLVDDETYGKRYDPIVFLTEAYIVDNNDADLNKRPSLTGSDSNINIEITIGNHETALTDVSLNIPIAIYKNGTVSQANYVKTFRLGELVDVNTNSLVNQAVKPGEANEVRVRMNITGSDALVDGIYIVRLGDDSGLNGSTWEWKFGLNSESAGTPDPDRGIGVASRAYRDCSWDDQSVRAAKLNIFPDAATVQAYSSVDIAIFDNDILPDSFFSPFEWGSNDILSQPVNGTLTIVGTGRNTKVRYHNMRTDNLTHSVDSFTYQASFIDPTVSTTVPQTKTTTAYIYVLQSETGFATCSPSYTVVLKELPQGYVTFNWYKEGEFMQTGASKTINNIQADSTYMIEPRISTTFTSAYYRNVSFPTGELKVQYTDNAVTSTMKWTGTVNNDWYNPWNWVEVKNNTEIPVSYAPNGCVDVIIPSNAPNYPELTYDTKCNNITMEDRAIIGKIHLLDYNKAKVELTLRPTEKERFVMWSAPLRDMYTGDYHYTDNNGNPVWGDIYMNFFQSANPDGGAEHENAFTATFGDVNTKLPLGTPFNIRVENRGVTKTFQFPRTQTSYKDANGNTSSQPLSRSNSSRFIFEEMGRGSDGIPTMKVNGENNYRMIQVSNPFMAYLDAGEFLAANSSVIESAYKIWDGDTTSNFVSIKYVDEATGQRYFIENVNAVASETGGYIPPLQSFFVMKKTSSEPVSELKMSGEWTTAVITNGPDYTLRSNVNNLEQHILRVTASDGTNSNTTILYYDEMAVPDYRGDEDSYKLFNPYSPLEVYTIARTYEPLAFYASGDYTQTVRLGLRMQKAGQITLDFVGMERFRHDVYLIDHEDNEKVYDLSMNPSLTFDIEGYSTGQYIDLPNRFSLSFTYTGYDASNETIPDNLLKAVSTDGTLHISAGGMDIENLQVYNLWGQLVYASKKSDTSFKVSVPSNQFYIVKGQVNYQIQIVKVITK